MTENERREQFVDVWIRGFYAGAEHYGKPNPSPLLQSEIESQAFEAWHKFENKRGE